MKNIWKLQEKIRVMTFNLDGQFVNDDERWGKVCDGLWSLNDDGLAKVEATLSNKDIKTTDELIDLLLLIVET